MLKRRILKVVLIFVLLISIFSLIFPSVADAALVPCGKSTDSGMCTLCHLIIGIKDIMDYGFKIMVVVAIVMLMVSGIVYIVSTGNTGMMDTAKHLLTNALIGFAIILGAWLVINTVILVLGAKGDLGVQAINWYTFECTPTTQLRNQQNIK